MRLKICFVVVGFWIITTSTVTAGFLDDLLNTLNTSTQKELSDSTIVSGLKEALSLGTQNAVIDVSRINGYFANNAIKVLMPEKLRSAADMLSQIGFQKEVDEFVLSMNRAAEKAAPQATAFFIDAIKEMSFDDAKKILNGSETAATNYFREKTSSKLFAAFKPIISSSMDQVGVTHQYKQLIRKYETIPFVQKQTLDIDHYVTNKALEGLFYMVGEEEKKIRTDPAARVTDLLKTVFGR